MKTITKVRVISVDDATCCIIIREAHERNVSLQDVASGMSLLGYKSKSGKLLTGSHLSNFARKDLGLRRAEEYTKPHYAAWNHETCSQAKVLGLWKFKRQLDDFDSSDQRGYGSILDDADWADIAAAGPEWSARFVQYLVHLATN